MFAFGKKLEMPAAAADALPGRPSPIPTAREHFVNGHLAQGPLSRRAGAGDVRAWLLLGRRAQILGVGDGVYVTAAGYAGGFTPNPTYEEVCSGRTGHNEVVLVVYDPKKISYERLLKAFWKIMTRRRACVRAMTSVRNTAPAFTCSRRRNAPPPRPRARAMPRRWRLKAWGRSRRKSARRRHSTLPRITTSNIWR